MKCQKCGAEFEGNFCPNCGTRFASAPHKCQCGYPLSPEAKFCPKCGMSVGQSELTRPASCYQNTAPTFQNAQNTAPVPVQNMAFSMPPKQGIKCPRCGQVNVSVQAVAEMDKRGCISTLMWIVLSMFTLGLALIPLLRGKKSHTRSYAICQTCGHRWRI